MRFTLYPIHRVCGEADDEQFDLRRLPFDVVENARIECVSESLRDGSFDQYRARLGTAVVEEMEQVEYAIVHRYQSEPIVIDGELRGERLENPASEQLVRSLAACLRLIRPMRQSALLMKGRIRDEDGSFDISGFDIPPLHLYEVPEIQKLFALRDRDAEDLRAFAPEFLRAMRGEFWKFRMAVQFHDLGHFQALDWKARYLQWCSAIESIYTSHNWEHQGSLVATSRIKWLIGANSSIYGPGDISNLIQDPHLTVGQVVGDLYEMRNFMAHGDKIPDRFFVDVLRRGFNGDVQKREVLLEAASFIIRASLLKILRDGLLIHFADATPAEVFWAGHNLTKTQLRAVQRAAQQPPIAQPGP